MKLKEKIQRLRTSLVNQKGFTLIELIVVIAILGILAGVAVPVYSGYIKKANMAADLQLLSAVNTAFASACLENGESAIHLPEATDLVVNDDGTVGGVTVPASESVPSSDAIEASFTQFFAGNENAKFKVLKDSDLKYISEKGVFDVDPTELNSMWAEVANTIQTNHSGALADLNASVFGTNIGAAGLLDTTSGLGNDVAGALADIMAKPVDKQTDTDKAILAALQGGAFYDTLSASLGGVSGDEYKQAFEALVTDKAKALALAAGKTEDDYMSYMQAASGQILANNAILTAAGKTQVAGSTEEEKITNFLNAVQSGVDYNAMKTDNTGTQLSNGASIYAMYIAYANRIEDEEEKKQALARKDDYAGIMEGVKNPDSDDFAGFRDYLADKDGKGYAKTDAAGYIGAMEVINGGAADSDVKKDILLNGISTDNAQLLALMNQLMGTK